MLKHCFKYKGIDPLTIKFFLLSFGANLTKYHLNNERDEPIFRIGNYYGATTQNAVFPLDNLVLKPSQKYSNNGETTTVSNMRDLCLEGSRHQLLTMTTIALCAYKVENIMLKKKDMKAKLALIDSHKEFINHKICQIIINVNGKPDKKTKTSLLRQNQSEGVEWRNKKSQYN